MEIEFSKVGFSYRENTPSSFTVLKNVSFKIESGTITGIIGKNSSGKTTLTELISGTLKPTSGKIYIDNVLMDELSLKELSKNIGFLSQFPYDDFFHDTVYKEIAYASEKNNYRVDELEKRVIDSLYLVGLNKNCLNRDPFTLSNGEKRLVALARILICNPKVLVLDEPTIGLDDISKKNLLNLLVKLKKRCHKTIIVVSHDVDFLHKFVNNIMVLNSGSVRIHDNKYEVFKEEARLKRYSLEVPKLIHFPNLVLELKNKKIGYRDEINDLIKDIYRYVK